MLAHPGLVQVHILRIQKELSENLESPIQILDCLKCGFEESKRQTASANVDVHLHCLQLARWKNVADTFIFCGLEGWPG